MDGIGNMTEASGSFPVTVAFMNENNKCFGIRDIVLETGTTLYDFVLPSRPAKVVLDPDYLYLAAERDKASREVN